MSQVKQHTVKKSKSLSCELSISKMDNPTKRPLEQKRPEHILTAKVRPGAISKSIPPPELSSSKESIIDMSYTNSTSKPKKTSSPFIESQKHTEHTHKHASELLKPKLKSHIPPNATPNTSLLKSNPDQMLSGTFKTKAEKKSMLPEKTDEKLGKDSNGFTYWYSGGKKIFKSGEGKQERELAYNGSKDCMKLIKSLKQSNPSSNQDLISKLDSVYIRIQQASKKSSKEGHSINSDNSSRSDFVTSDLKHFQDKKSSHKTHSSLQDTTLEPKPKKSVKKHTSNLLIDSSNTSTKISPGYDGHSQVYPSIKRDMLPIKSKESFEKPFLHRPTFEKSPDLTPHKYSKQPSIEAMNSPVDVKHIDPSHFPNDPQRKKRGRPPGSTDKTKKKLANKSLGLHPNRGRPKKNLGILGKAKSSLPRQFKQQYEELIKHSNPGIRVSSKDPKHQISDTKVTYEVQETSESMSIEGKRKNEEMIRSEQRRKDIERDKIKMSSKKPLTPFTSKLSDYKDSPVRKRPPIISTSSEEEDNNSLKPPPKKCQNFRDSKSSDSDIADVPKTPGATSFAPTNPFMDYETKDENIKSSSPKKTASPYRKSTELPVIGHAPSRGKYMPKRQDRSPPHLISKQPSSESESLERSHSKPKPDSGRSMFSGKKIVMDTSSKSQTSISGQKQSIRAKLLDSSKSEQNPSSTLAESSGESSSDTDSESGSSSSSDESDDSHAPHSLPAQPSNPHTPLAAAKRPEVPEHPRVAFVFTTELANKAAAAVSRGEVRTIVEFHKKNQASLSHLKLSSERRQNLEQRNKSPGQNGNGIQTSGKKIVETLPPQLASSTTDTSTSSGGESDSSDAESRPQSPTPSKPVRDTSSPMDTSTLYNSYESSDQQEVSNSPQMIPKTPGPPPGLNLPTSDDDSEYDEVMKSPRPVQRPYRGKSRMNMTSSSRDQDASDLQDDYGRLNIVPKTPGAGLNKDMELSDDDDNYEDEVKGNDKDQSDDDKTTFDTNVEFDKPPRAPRPPQLSDDEEETRPRSDFYTRPTSPQFDNIIKDLNSAQHLPIHEISPSISPLDLHITPRQDHISPSTGSNNASSKNTPTIIPSNESYNSQQASCAKLPLDMPPMMTPRDNMQYNYPASQQFIPESNHGKGLPLSHYNSPSRTPMRTTPPTNHNSTPSHQPTSLQEAISAPYHTPDTRRPSYIQPIMEHTGPEMGIIQQGRKDSIDAAVYPIRPPISTAPYLYPAVTRPQVYQNNPTVNMGYMPQHPRDMFHANPLQLEQTHFNPPPNDSSPLGYPQQEHTTLPSEILTSRYPHPTDTLPPNMHPTGGTHYYPNTTGYPRMATPRHESQPPADLGGYSLQSTLAAHINRTIAPVYVNGDSMEFNGVVRKQVPPTHLQLSDRQESLVRTFSDVSASNLQGTPLDTNIDKLAPSLRMNIDIMTAPPQEHTNTPITAADNFTFTETVTHSPKKVMASCSTSPPPQPVKPAPRPPKPEMVDSQMQTDGDDTWDNSKPEMDEVLQELDTDNSMTVTTSTATTTSTECQTELSPVNKVLDSALQTRPIVWEQSDSKKPQEEEEEKGFVIRIPVHKISKDTKFLNGKLADDFVNLAELPKLTPLNPKDRDKHFLAKLGAENVAIIRNKHCDPPPLRSLFNPEQGMPQLTPIRNLISNGFHSLSQPELDYRDLPKLRPLIPLLVSNNS